MKVSGNGPLAQMRVLDLSQQLPGPYATELLASLGAKVTKIEPPSGDAGRHLDAAMFNNVNAGKDSITLNLKTESGKQALHDLVPSYDVFVEGFRPGVTSRLSCDYTTLKKIIAPFRDLDRMVHFPRDHLMTLACNLWLVLSQKIQFWIVLACHG